MLYIGGDPNTVHMASMQTFSLALSLMVIIEARHKFGTELTIINMCAFCMKYYL